MKTKTADQIMTRGMVKIAWNAPLSEAYLKMTAGRIRHLPVTDPTGLVIGILSDRDLQRAMLPKRETALLSGDQVSFDPGSRVKDYMSFPVRTVESSLSIRDTAEILIEEKISALVVTGPGRAPIGIVTTEDLLRYLASLLDRDPARLKRPLNDFIAEAQLREDYFE